MFNLHRESYALSRLIRIMKLTIVILLFTFISATASVYSQVTKLDFKVQDRTVKEILNQIEDRSDFFFMYNDRKVDVTRKVNLDLKQAKIEDILEKIFEGTNTKFIVKNRQIVIYNENVEEIDPSNSGKIIQQQKSISGKVTDSSGSPLPGVSLIVKGTNNGTITDANGNYSLSNVPEYAVLQFSFVGMKTQEVKVEGKSSINVILAEESIGIDEVVAVGYGTQKKESLIGAIGSVKSDQLLIAPVASTSNALAGRLPGLISLQSNGLPGKDAAYLSIRGFGSALIIVDGVERDFNALDPDEIESVSILKDASSSIYGSRAGNGVILVTTKRGNNQKPTITYKSSFTNQGIIFMPKPSSSGQYAEMKRESWIQSGQPEATAPFSLDAIQKYYEGGDPQYPNTNWYDLLIRDWAPQQQHNLSVRGGLRQG